MINILYEWLCGYDVSINRFDSVIYVICMLINAVLHCYILSDDNGGVTVDVMLKQGVFYL